MLLVQQVAKNNKDKLKFFIEEVISVSLNTNPNPLKDDHILVLADPI